MKVHVAIGQYEFVEADVETHQDAKEAYDNIKAAFAPDDKSGLDDKTWRTVLDKYLTVNTMHTEEYYAMSHEQQKVIQEIKKSFKRIQARENGLPEIQND